MRELATAHLATDRKAVAQPHAASEEAVVVVADLAAVEGSSALANAPWAAVPGAVVAASSVVAQLLPNSLPLATMTLGMARSPTV
jgi:hypothetical protein